MKKVNQLDTGSLILNADNEVLLLIKADLNNFWMLNSNGQFVRENSFLKTIDNYVAAEDAEVLRLKYEKSDVNITNQLLDFMLRKECLLETHLSEQFVLMVNNLFKYADVNIERERDRVHPGMLKQLAKHKVEAEKIIAGKSRDYYLKEARKATKWLAETSFRNSYCSFAIDAKKTRKIDFNRIRPLFFIYEIIVPQYPPISELKDRAQIRLDSFLKNTLIEDKK